MSSRQFKANRSINSISNHKRVEKIPKIRKKHKRISSNQTQRGITQSNNACLQIQTQSFVHKKQIQQYLTNFWSSTFKLYNLAPQILSQKLDFLRKSVEKPTTNLQKIFNMRTFQALWPIPADQTQLVTYLSFLGKLRSYQISKYQFFALINGDKGFILKLQAKSQEQKKLICINPLSLQQIYAMNKRGSFIEKISQQQQKFSVQMRNGQRLTQISQQILFQLHNLVNNSNSMIAQTEKIEQQIFRQMEVSKPNTNASYQQYLELIVLKNLKNTFEDTQIDYFNYFIEKEEQGFLYQKIIQQKEFEEFLQKRKPKVNKAGKFTIHSDCVGCFSNHQQSINYFQYCQKCSKRYHRLCKGSSKQCDYCYHRQLRNKHRKKILQCCICGLKGLMLRKISNNLHIHIFCLLTHNFWKIQQEAITLNEQLISKANLKRSNSSQICSYCSSEFNFYLRCQTCSQKHHGSCAYLTGCHMQLSHGRNVKLNCCIEYKQKISYRRKWKINYQQFVYKNVYNKQYRETQAVLQFREQLVKSTQQLL